MIFFAFLCIAIGVWPEPLYASVALRGDSTSRTRGRTS